LGVHGGLPRIRHTRALDPLVHPGATARISNPDAAIVSRQHRGLMTSPLMKSTTAVENAQELS